MATPANQIPGNVVSDEIVEIVKNQKYLSSKAFYTIGGSSLGVWLFNGISSEMTRSFMGEESYKGNNCDFWLKLSGLFLSLVVAFVGAKFLKKTTVYDKLATFFTGLMIFFCATSANSITGYFKSDTSTELKAQTISEVKQNQLGMFPFRNAPWFPSEALVEEVGKKDAVNDSLNRDSQQIINFVADTAENIANPPPENQLNKATGISVASETKLSKAEILNNLESYKTSVERLNQASPNISSKNLQIQKHTAAEAETKGFSAIINLDFNSALQSFQQAYQAWAIYHNVDEINKLLQSVQPQFAQADNERKNLLWQNIYCEVSLKYQWGMSTDIRNQFLQKLKIQNYGCKATK